MLNLFYTYIGQGYEGVGVAMAEEPDDHTPIGAQQYVTPKLGLNAFHCPRCRVYAAQTTKYLFVDNRGHVYNPITITECFNCREDAIWLHGRIVYPEYAGVVPPNPDLSDEIKADYAEAAAILQRSPRGAAALLRLCIEKLCKQLGLTGRVIDDDIAELVRQGLPEEIQMALDTVRVIGNKAVHPGELDLNDDPTIAITLFGLVNIIADDRISRKKRIAAAYSTLPEVERDKIDKRNKKALQGAQQP